MDVVVMNVDEILETYGPAIARVAAGYAPPGPAREDLRQDIAIAIMKAAPAFRGDASMKTYIYRIAHNCGIDLIKRRKEEGVEFVEEHYKTANPGPEERTLEKEKRERLAAAIRRLPLSTRQPLVLRLEGLSYKEIAEVLDLTTSNVGVRLHRAADELKNELGRS